MSCLTIFLTDARSRLGGFSDTLRIFEKSTETFVEAFETKFQLKNEEEMKLEMGLELSHKSSCFELKPFFKGL